VKQIKKKRLSKNQRLLIILGSVFAVLLVASIITLSLLFGKDEPTTELTPPEVLEEEGIKNNYAIAYPEVTDELIRVISVKNKHGEFALMRIEEKGDFILYYTDENGNEQVYYPQICEDEDGFDYSDLYALEMGDSLQAISKVQYLCLALEAPYFSERIYLSDDPVERERELDAYGLTEDNIQTIFFDYYLKDEDGKNILDEDGKPKMASHRIKIGDEAINGSGRYFIVDDRSYVYCSRNNYFEYGLADFASFIKATLVAAGLPSDNGFGPYLTPNYFQWITERFGGAKKDDDASVPVTTVPEGSTVIAYTDLIYPSTDPDELGRYSSSGYSLREIDLASFKDNANYLPLINMLVGKGVGERDGKSYDLSASMITLSKQIAFGDADSLEYEYTILSIEGVLTENGDIIAHGTPISATDKVRVKYTYTVDGTPALDGMYTYGVIDLADPLMSEGVSKICAKTVGPLDTPITFKATYTKLNSASKNVRFVISEILTVLDAKGNVQKKIGEDSIFTYYAYKEIDGVKGEKEIYKSTPEESDKTIRNLLMGYGVGEFATPKLVSETVAYYEALYDAVTYKISRIDAYTTNELVVAFRFKNATERDPYYGESLYENLLSGKHSLYGLNAPTCEGVVKVLGGITSDGSAGSANGLFGGETLAIGLTPEIKEKYGLYAYTIYYELPRNIQPYETPEGGEYSDESDDYYWYNTLAFTLYISEEDPLTGKRFVGSDMYDVVTEVDGEKFAFLEYDFESFWARRNLVLMDINHIDKMQVEFFMDDIKGNYVFDLDHKDAWVNGNKETDKEPTESGWTKFNKISVTVHTSGEHTDTKLSEHIKNHNIQTGMLSLTELYNYEYRDKYQGAPDYMEKLDAYNKLLKDADFDHIGTAYFKEALRTLYLVGYSGTMTDAEQAEATVEEKKLMRISFKLLNVQNASHLNYVYTFYRADDRRVLVSIHQEDDDGNVKIQPVSDLYISTFALKKIVANIQGILNAELIKPELAYPDYVHSLKKD